MNRSVLLEEFPCALPPSAPLTVATSWTHPRRGQVRCPAHPLLSSAADRAGTPPGQRAFTAHDLAADTAEFSLITVSYEDRHSVTTGLAVAVRADDEQALSFARGQIRQWRSVLRTRRLLLPDQDFAPAPALSLPAQTAARWSVCGCPASAGCQAAKDAAATVRAFRERGDHVLLIGGPLPATAAEAPFTVEERAGLTEIRTPEQAVSLVIEDPSVLAFVVTPGTPAARLSPVLAVLRRRLPGLRGQHPSQWCYAMTDWWQAAEAVVQESDLVLVTGSGHHPGAAVTRAAAERLGVPVHSIDSLDELRTTHVDAATITLVDAGATGAGRNAVAGVLAGLGPCSTVRRTVRSRREPAPARQHLPAPGRVPGPAGPGPADIPSNREER
ncbi:4-hydroxy-3-methylbut-2-enyl diphosphate reductase [Streptomyces sp. NPDC054863]